MTIDRRRFLLGTAGFAGCAYLGSTVTRSASAGEPARKIVTVGGRRVTVVDIHAHLVIPAVEPILRGSSLKPTFPKDVVIGPDRIAHMDSRGIDVQALSINEYWWYAAERDLAAKIVRAHDEGIAEWCKAHPQRFVALTSPAVQFPDLAAEQVEYAVKTLGFRGASVGGAVRGEAPSTEKYDPFWRKVEELQVPVFMHPYGTGVVDRKLIQGPGDLSNIAAYPFETTIFLSRLIFDGVFDRFPRVKVCGAHGGGYLPSYLGRTEVACDVRVNAKCINKRRPREYMRTNVMADTMVFSDEGLRHLVAEMGVSQIVYGSDMPFNWPDTIDIVVSSKHLNDDEKIAILGGNLVRMLKIPAA
jgi:aminocarboxymuconate-semialdehyde decarboxylase